MLNFLRILCGTAALAALSCLMQLVVPWLLVVLIDRPALALATALAVAAWLSKELSACKAATATTPC